MVINLSLTNLFSLDKLDYNINKAIPKTPNTKSDSFLKLKPKKCETISAFTSRFSGSNSFDTKNKKLNCKGNTCFTSHIEENFTIQLTETLKKIEKNPDLGPENVLIPYKEIQNYIKLWEGFQVVQRNFLFYIFVYLQR